MKEKISPFLRSMLTVPGIQAQYLITKNEPPHPAYNDPLMEDKHEVIKGLVNKYKNRALIKVSYLCASHCRFCTRIRQIGRPEGTLSKSEIDRIVAYLKVNPQIDDVILSGGDPLYTPKITQYLLQQIRFIPNVKTIRIGTRLPLQSPRSFATKTMQKLLALIDEIGKEKPVFILLHLEHPAELVAETEAVISQLRQLKVTLLSQTVFLKNVNDEFEILHKLFLRLYHLGVLPYYLYHCDQVDGLEHFQGDLEKEKGIASRLRATLSGIACPLFVEDIENGYGKLPVT